MTDSYDLFNPKPGWIAEKVLILTPYVEGKFFEQITKRLKPKQMHVVIDDGCRRDDLDVVEVAVTRGGGKRSPNLTRSLASASGLVHLKLFYVVWRTPTKRLARTLIFGSANATKQGFSGSINAELLTHCSLVASRHKAAIDWCEKVIDATAEKGRVNIEAERDIVIGEGITLRLPNLSVGRKKPELSNFDVWVQRGYLLNPYRLDPSFLRVPIQLGKGLPPAEQATIAARFGFYVPQTKRLNYAYVGSGASEADEADESDEEAEVRNWRRKFFVWTQLGDWCSEACYDLFKVQFRRRGSEERENRLTELAAFADGQTLAAARSRFLHSLTELWSAFGSDAPSLLRGAKQVDTPFYSALFNEKVGRDLEQARDPEFRQRFVSGYEVVSVPRFRNDVTGWQAFVRSLARELCADSRRRRSQSKLLNAVGHALEDTGLGTAPFEGNDTLLTTLRDRWLELKLTKSDGSVLLVANYHLL